MSKVLNMDGFYAVPKSEYEQLKAERRWIPVSERLPDELVLVLVYCCEAECVGVAHFAANEWYTPEPQVIDIEAGFTHWMPLPQPPEQGK